MNEYITKLSNKDLKHALKLYEKEKGAKITGLSRADQEALLKQNMQSNKKFKCLAKCKKGHCNCWHSKEDLTGAGFLDLFRSPKKDYTNSSKRTLKNYGEFKILSLEAVRTPILKILDRIINIISFGKFNKLKEKYSFDDLFHLQLIAHVQAGPVIKKIVIEKNENINISSSTSTKSTSQIQNIPVNKDLNLNQLLENTQKSIGSAKFFLYDGLKNNCQDFIIAILKANGLMTGQAESFIKQDITKLAEGLPPHVKKAMGITTQLGAQIQHAIGAGRATNDYWANKNKDSDFWKKQNETRNDLLKENAKNNKQSELDTYKQDLIEKKKAEVKEYERTHGNSGNFLTDFSYGVKSAKKKFFDPALAVVNAAAPVVNMIPGGKALTTSMNAFDKVATTVGAGYKLNPRLLMKYE